MKICVFGSKKSTIRLLNHLTKNKIKVDTLALIDPTKLKLVQISGHDSKIIEIAKDLGIKYFFVETYSLKSNTDKNFFRKESFDIGLCTSWQRIIPEDILGCFRFGVFGWHGSGYEFPNGRGRSPINWSIRLGLDVIFHNCFRYSNGVDSGDVYETKKLTIKKNDYIEDVQEKAIEHICDSAIRLIANVRDNKLKLSKQINHPFISFPSLNEKSGQLYPSRLDVSSALNIVRSCSHPFPGAYVALSEHGIKVRIWRAEILSTKLEKIQIDKGCLFFSDKYMLIGFFDGVLKLTDYEVKSEKKYKLPQNINLRCD